tara:strand:+ start:989 stop:1249 length:261 start_codon:yes stop_codon:yes gene_type:complete
MKNTIQRFDKRLNDFHRSIALQEWIPGVFDGEHTVKTQIIEKAPSDLPPGFNRNLSNRERYKSMKVLKANGESIIFPISEVPEELL